jgi:hypothetical protein
MGEPLSSIIRRVILESGESLYSIACKCRIDRATLSRFMAGKGGMGLATIDKLVAGLGIEVRLPGERKDR